ncbi:hypothetical protein VP249E411_P0028 [Vibrio phage 249E41-1]|nr:hypothetical protein VP249E411_P0028 [Vibrio phage 249E41-1]CAH9012191.1 hypothetical protein VP495E541_P0032 [Vibrio phage 495E54-1]CAH9012270.1 hypothetical protein VP496E541_P0032 [Vibrio phage 496E54-1]
MRKYPLCKRTIDALINDKEYITKLAEDLMLDELLVGECDAVEFLTRTLRQTYIDTIKKESMIKTKYHQEWVEGYEPKGLSKYA